DAEAGAGRASVEVGLKRLAETLDGAGPLRKRDGVGGDAALVRGKRVATKKRKTRREKGMTNERRRAEQPAAEPRVFGFLISDFFRHSSFVIRHLEAGVAIRLEIDLDIRHAVPRPLAIDEAARNEALDTFVGIAAQQSHARNDQHPLR